MKTIVALAVQFGIFLAVDSSACAAGLGHVEEIQYDPSSVVEIVAVPGYAVHLALDPNERIESAAIGDAEHWAVTAKDGTHDVFLKPRQGAVTTNLAVRTDLRSYSFELRVTHGGTATFRVEFQYPNGKLLLGAAPSINRRYSMQVGDDSARIVPNAAFDDDHFTYLSFGSHAEVPAVFEVTSEGKERLVNHHMSGDVLVVHTVAPQLELRLGGSVVSIFRDAPLVSKPAGGERIVDRLLRIDRDSLAAP